jgi:hypothetical protein
MENQGQPNEKLVKVFGTEREFEALVVKGLLDSAGIECQVTSVEAQQEIFPGVGGTIIRVREEDVEEAHKIINEYRSHPVEESEVTEEPSTEV